MGACASRPRGFPRREKSAVADTSATPKAVAPVESNAPVVEDKHEVIEASLVDLSTPKAKDAKVNEELAPGISELQIPVVEEAGKKDTEAIFVEETMVAAEKQN